MTKKNEQNEKPQGFYVKGAEEGGSQASQKSGASTKSAQKQKAGGRQQGIKKGKASQKSSARFSADEEGSPVEAEDIEQDQDDQS
jgi:hypothetical protein